MDVDRRCRRWSRRLSWEWAWWQARGGGGSAADDVRSAGGTGAQAERTSEVTRRWPNAAFSVVMTDKVSGHIVVVDPLGRALRLPTRSEGTINPLDVPPNLIAPELGGLPSGRRPVAVLDRSIVLVPSSTAGHRRVWGGGAHPVADAGRFVAASENRIATVEGECTDCALRITSSEGQVVQVIEAFAGFQPVSRAGSRRTGVGSSSDTRRSIGRTTASPSRTWSAAPSSRFRG